MFLDGMPKSPLKWINLGGAYGRTFTIAVTPSDATVTGPWFGSIEAPRRQYDNVVSLCSALDREIQGALGLATPAAGSQSRFIRTASGTYDPKFQIQFFWNELRVSNNDSCQMQVVITPASGGWPCHALQALGMDISAPITVDVSAGGSSTVNYDRAGVRSYHPCRFECSGPYLCVESTDKFFDGQGDGPSGEAYVIVDDAKLNPSTDTDGAHLMRYYDKSVAIDPTMPVIGGTETPCLVMRLPADWELAAAEKISRAAYVGHSDGDEPAMVEQVYVPFWKDASGRKRGPFEMLLFPLLSTGTPGYNHPTYDCLPYELSVGFDASLIDAESFLDADAEIGLSDLSRRQRYIIRQ